MPNEVTRRHRITAQNLLRDLLLVDLSRAEVACAAADINRIARALADAEAEAAALAPWEALAEWESSSVFREVHWDGGRAFAIDDDADGISVEVASVDFPAGVVSHTAAARALCEKLGLLKENESKWSRLGRNAMTPCEGDAMEKSERLQVGDVVRVVPGMEGSLLALDGWVPKVGDRVEHRYYHVPGTILSLHAAVGIHPAAMVRYDDGKTMEGWVNNLKPVAPTQSAPAEPEPPQPVPMTRAARVLARLERDPYEGNCRSEDHDLRKETDRLDALGKAKDRMARMALDRPLEYDQRRWERLVLAKVPVGRR